MAHSHVASVGKGFNLCKAIQRGICPLNRWQDIRQRVILRDNGCDLGIDDRPINTKVIIHHLNPITIDQVVNFDPAIFDLNNLVCCSHATHNAIHYGDASLLATGPIERTPNDTCPWR